MHIIHYICISTRVIKVKHSNRIAKLQGVFAERKAKHEKAKEKAIKVFGTDDVDSIKSIMSTVKDLQAKLDKANEAANQHLGQCLDKIESNQSLSENDKSYAITLQNTLTELHAELNKCGVPVQGASHQPELPIHNQQGGTSINNNQHNAQLEVQTNTMTQPGDFSL